MRWVNLAVLSDETGVPTRTLQHIRRHEAGVLVERTNRGKTEYSQPQCAINLRKREVAKATERLKPDTATETVADAERRKKSADADLAELRLAQALRELMPVASAIREREREFAGFNAMLDAVPSREASQWPEVLPGLAIQRLRGIIARLKESLQRALDEAAAQGEDGEEAIDGDEPAGESPEPEGTA